MLAFVLYTMAALSVHRRPNTILQSKPGNGSEDQLSGDGKSIIVPFCPLGVLSGAICSGHGVGHPPLNKLGVSKINILQWHLWHCFGAQIATP